MATNHLPAIRGTDYAIWRRIRLIPFKVRIPKRDQDPGLPEKLRHELPGILNWAIEGCRAWRRERLGEPKQVRRATAAYRQEQDVLGQFIDECLDKGGDNSETLKSIYDRYASWAKEANLRPEYRNVFAKLLQERGFHIRKAHGNVRIVEGLQTRQQKPKLRYIEGGKAA